MSLEDIKSDKYKEIEFNYNKTINGLITFNLTGIDIDMVGGLEILNKLELMIEYMDDNPSIDSVLIIDYYKISKSFTKQQLIELRKSIRDYGIAQNGKRASLYKAVNDATTIEEVNAINW